MRVKELRLALVCYGGVSLAVYMHGITKEVWKLLQASRAVADGSGDAGLDDSARVYRALLDNLGDVIRVRVLTDIVAGASAGGINGVFLAHAMATGQSMEPLRTLWLEGADVETLLDPAARPSSAMAKMWMAPFTWAALRGRQDSVDELVGAPARDEVRRKLGRFVRSRWFEPPFGGETFTGLLLDAFDAMAAAPLGKCLIPPGLPLDLFVTVTDFQGHPQRLRLNSPPEVMETEHRLVIGFTGRGGEGAAPIADPAELVFAARATASFPGAFPPFQVKELDNVLAARGCGWAGREAFLDRVFPRQRAAGVDPEELVLIDGSVLANAPFRPAIEALRQRPAHREIDRRFVYIDPKAGRRSIRMTRSEGGPGFFTTILRSMSDIPREQPIRDNLEAIESMSRRIRRMRYVVEAMRPEVEAAIDRELGGTFFLDRPNRDRLVAWRAKANAAAAAQADYTYAAYGYLKLSQIIEEMGRIIGDVAGGKVGVDAARRALWAWIEAQGLDSIAANIKGARPEAIAFFRRWDLGFRIRRLRFLARRLEEVGNEAGSGSGVETARREVYELLSPYLDRRRTTLFAGRIDTAARAVADDPGAAAKALGDAYDLARLDVLTDEKLADAFASLEKPYRRPLLLAYLGFPFYDIATLPLLQGEGLDEFDPIKVDRIAPDDAPSIRAGGAEATLKGIEFNSFGAFFSRAYRENDYLWGRLHGAERMIDILLSTLPDGTLAPGVKATAKRDAFLAIIEAEAAHLTAVPDLIDSLCRELGAGN